MAFSICRLCVPFSDGRVYVPLSGCRVYVTLSGCRYASPVPTGRSCTFLVGYAGLLSVKFSRGTVRSERMLSGSWRIISKALSETVSAAFPSADLASAICAFSRTAFCRPSEMAWDA